MDATVQTHLRSLLKTSKYAVRKSSSMGMGSSNESFPLAVMAASVLGKLLAAESHWPVDLLELYFDDALGARWWVGSSSPDAALFCDNLLAWTTSQSTDDHSHHGHSNHSSSSISNKAIEDDGNDSSSGEEEVIEESEGKKQKHQNKAVEGLDRRVLAAAATSITTTTTTAAAAGGGGVASAVYNRFSKCGREAMDLTLSWLNARLDPKSTSSAALSSANFSSGTWTVVATIASLCGLGEVRRLAVTYLRESWLKNPALEDSVPVLFKRLVECLEIDRKSDAGALIPSDHVVVEELVRMRGKIKKIELYRSILTETVRKGPTTARLVLTSLIAGDLAVGAVGTGGGGGGGVKPEDTVKLLGALLGAIQDTNTPTSSSSSSSSSSPSAMTKNDTACKVLGESIGLVCVNSIRDSSATPKWSFDLNRTMLGTISRLVKLLGVREANLVSLLRGILFACPVHPFP